MHSFSHVNIVTLILNTHTLIYNYLHSTHHLTHTYTQSNFLFINTHSQIYTPIHQRKFQHTHTHKQQSYLKTYCWLAMKGYTLGSLELMPSGEVVGKYLIIHTKPADASAWRRIPTQNDIHLLPLHTCCLARSVPPAEQFDFCPTSHSLALTEANCSNQRVRM